VTGFALYVIQVDVIISQICIVGTYDLEIPGKDNYSFPVALSKYFGECLRANISENV